MIDYVEKRSRQLMEDQERGHDERKSSNNIDGEHENEYNQDYLDQEEYYDDLYNPDEVEGDYGGYGDDLDGQGGDDDED